MCHFLIKETWKPGKEELWRLFSTALNVHLFQFCKLRANSILYTNFVYLLKNW
jgi:hypothetical protein